VSSIDSDFYPPSLKEDLKTFTNGKNWSERIFSNSKGSKVERTHVINAVKRACKKMKCDYNLNPSDIAAWVPEFHGWVYSG
jgi:hypothetical protein